MNVKLWSLCLTLSMSVCLKSPLTGLSFQQPVDPIIKKISQLSIMTLVTGGFPSQRANNVESVSSSWMTLFHQYQPYRKRTSIRRINPHLFFYSLHIHDQLWYCLISSHHRSQFIWRCAHILLLSYHNNYTKCSQRYKPWESVVSQTGQHSPELYDTSLNLMHISWSGCSGFDILIDVVCVIHTMYSN